MVQERYHRFKFTLDLCSEMINYYDMDSRAIQREAYRTLARGGAENRANGHCCVNLPIGSDRGRSKRLACRHCLNIGAHGGAKQEREKKRY